MLISVAPRLATPVAAWGGTAALFLAAFRVVAVDRWGSAVLDAGVERDLSRPPPDRGRHRAGGPAGARAEAGPAAPGESRGTAEHAVGAGLADALRAALARAVGALARRASDRPAPRARVSLAARAFAGLHRRRAAGGLHRARPHALRGRHHGAGGRRGAGQCLHWSCGCSRASPLRLRAIASPARAPRAMPARSDAWYRARRGWCSSSC